MKAVTIIAIAVLGAGALIGAFFLFGPEARVEAVKASWRRFREDQGQVCFDLWSSSLKDPKSAQLVSSNEVEGDLLVGYRATNSYGAYGTGYFTCPIKNGKVDRISIILKRSDDALENFRRANEK